MAAVLPTGGTAAGGIDKPGFGGGQAGQCGFVGAGPDADVDATDALGGSVAGSSTEWIRVGSIRIGSSRTVAKSAVAKGAVATGIAAGQFGNLNVAFDAYDSDSGIRHGEQINA
mgnify:CR=1